MIKSQISKAMRILASTLDALGPQELEALIAGRGKLIYIVADQSARPAPAPAPGMNAVVDRLGACQNRDQARQILVEITNKEQLTSLARNMKIHIMKHDRREDIENKIIEFAIGRRLSSKAIQTLNLQGSGRYVSRA